MDSRSAGMTNSGITDVHAGIVMPQHNYPPSKNPSKAPPLKCPSSSNSHSHAGSREAKSNHDQFFFFEMVSRGMEGLGPAVSMSRKAAISL